MTKSWRPEGWKIPRQVEDKSFEVGADAMLEALIGQPHQNWLATNEGKTAKDIWVFIPDEEVTESWRPPEWDDIEAHITFGLNERYGDKPLLAIAKAVEAGADAMLAKLKSTPNYLIMRHESRGIRVDLGTFTFPVNGRIVFIPDEEVTE